jgi:hypothetical protein
METARLMRRWVVVSLISRSTLSLGLRSFNVMLSDGRLPSRYVLSVSRCSVMGHWHLSLCRIQNEIEVSRARFEKQLRAEISAKQDSVSAASHLAVLGPASVLSEAPLTASDGDIKLLAVAISDAQSTAASAMALAMELKAAAAHAITVTGAPTADFVQDKGASAVTGLGVTTSEQYEGVTRSHSAALQDGCISAQVQCTCSWVLGGLEGSLIELLISLHLFTGCFEPPGYAQTA